MPSGHLIEFMQRDGRVSPCSGLLAWLDIRSSTLTELEANASITRGKAEVPELDNALSPDRSVVAHSVADPMAAIMRGSCPGPKNVWFAEGFATNASSVSEVVLCAA